MKNIESWLNVNFESSCSLTPEFSSFARQFKAYVKKICGSDFEIVGWSRGHFYLSGFLKNKKTNKLSYFSTSDVRHFPGEWYKNLLVRTAEHEKDYRGGRNNWTTLPEIIKVAEKLTS